MLKHKKLISIIATLAFCLSFLAPAFIAPAPAVAATSYITLTAPTIETPYVPVAGLGIQLGKVALDIDEIGALQVGDVVTVSLPKEAKYARALGATSVGIDAAATPARPAVPATDVNIITTSDLNADAAAELAGFTFAVGLNNPNSFDLRVTGIPAAASGKARILFDFRNMQIESYTGDISAKFISPSSVFTGGTAVIGKTTSGRSAFLSSNGVNSGTATIEPDTVMLIESAPNAFRTGDVFTLALPSGYRWAVRPGVTGGWGLTNAANSIAGGGIAMGAAYDDGRKIDITLTGTFASSATTAGRLSIGYVGNWASVVPDDSVAQPGDVAIDVSTANTAGLAAVSLAPSELTYCKYVEFGITMEATESVEIVAGKNDVKAGKLVISEGAAGSIVANRTINLMLPNGVLWHKTDVAPPAIGVTTFPTITTQKGTNLGWVVADIGTDGRSIRLTPGLASTSAAKIEFSNLRFDVSPAFSGPIEIEVGGTQGITGKYKVAEVLAPLTIKTDATTKVNIGSADQALPDISITEVKKETIRSRQKTVSGTAPGGDQAQLAIVLPPGVTFTSLPTVAVTEGDLSLDITGAYKTNVFDNILRGAYIIPIKSSSIKPSTIKISNIKVTLDRTVAEGALKITVSSVPNKDALDENYWATGRAATSPQKLFTYEGYVSATIADCVTPAPGDQGRSASFYIGSTIMNVNGSNVIMDASPYIKAGRTYVPVRYLGDSLAATTAWDAATQTVTVTKGDKTVVLVIGSKTAKVNGADVAMDVAPEITNGRTMLPARYVAEGLGYAVGWNAALGQVVIQ